MPTENPEHFKSTPWCAALLSDPTYEIIPSRYNKPNRRRHGDFFTRTLATDDTIRACIHLKRVPQQQDSPQQQMLPEVRALIDTGSGLNGYPNVSHGGFVAAYIDEIMGVLINSNRRGARTEQEGKQTFESSPLSTGYSGPSTSPSSTFTTSSPQQHSSSSADHFRPGSYVMTAELTTTYRSPVPTGRPILARSWVDRIDGRKLFVKASIEDGEGKVLAEGKGLFLALRDNKPPVLARREEKL
jgi:acyl-coenzyme A thioesterase THEM4